MSKSKIVVRNLLSLLKFISNLLLMTWIWMNLAKRLGIFCIDEKIRSVFDSKDREVKWLDWWIKVLTRYSTLFKIVNVILSIFHGPRVVGNFSEMKYVIDSTSEQIDIATFDAIQTVKYSLWQQAIEGSYLFTLTCVLYLLMLQTLGLSNANVISWNY